MKIKFVDRKTGEIKYEKPPAEGLLNFLYDNPFGKSLLLPIAKRKLISSMYGKKMNKASSVRKIQKFVSVLGIDMTESVKSISEFTSFNDFFYRKLKPLARPIAENIVSPGDGRLLAFENIRAVNKFFVKGREFTLAEFLDNKELAKKHEDSTLLILRLAPNDYHRYHFPYAGIASESVPIKGSYFSVSPYALVNNFVKVFCQNKREYCLLTTPDKGDIIMSPVGATMVGSIYRTYTPNTNINKGDEMGYFAFGGSTIVMLFEKDKVKIDADLLANTKNRIETFVKMGEKIGE